MRTPFADDGTLYGGLAHDTKAPHANDKTHPAGDVHHRNARGSDYDDNYTCNDVKDASGSDKHATDAVISRIKHLMFEYVDSSDTIPALVRRRDFDGVASDIISACYKAAMAECPEDGPLASGVLATSMLHYILTRALIKSQRNITYQNVNVDIVIPDAKTLGCDPHRALLICIAKTGDTGALQKILHDASRIQPIKENIWIILPRQNTITSILAHGHGDDGNGDGKTDDFKDHAVRKFFISKDGGSFAGMPSKIGRFVNYGGRDGNAGRGGSGTGSDNLRILGI